MRLISSLQRLSVPLALWLAACSGVVHAGVVQVAVAANFAAPFQKIATGFSADTGHQVQVIIGSTGKFHTQIRAGAPFDVLLAADDETPRQLEAEGLAVKGQRFTYAKGKLVLWSAQAGLVDPQGAVLHQGVFKRLALANPKLAPYGAAAVQALQCLGLHERLSDRLVMGDNIAQAWQFVSTGNAELGLLALSQVVTPDRPSTGSWWMVPARCYAPLLQDAALLMRAERHAPARALLNYLQGDKARAVIQSYGYDL